MSRLFPCQSLGFLLYLSEPADISILRQLQCQPLNLSLLLHDNWSNWTFAHGSSLPALWPVFLIVVKAELVEDLGGNKGTDLILEGNEMVSMYPHHRGLWDVYCRPSNLQYWQTWDKGRKLAEKRAMKMRGNEREGRGKNLRDSYLKIIS